MIELIARHAAFGGVQSFHRHASRVTGGSMRFGVFRPDGVDRHAPALIYLAGLTCTEDTFAIKAGAQRHAAEHGLVLVTPDTSPRDTGIAGAKEMWDFGEGAGFYLDATQAPWAPGSDEAPPPEPPPDIAALLVSSERKPPRRLSRQNVLSAVPGPNVPACIGPETNSQNGWKSVNCAFRGS